MAEGAESVLFTQLFKDWKRRDQTVGRGHIYRHEKIAKIEKVKLLQIFVTTNVPLPVAEVFAF